MGDLAFIDTETTGLDHDRCPIWEIAVIIPDGPNKGEHLWQQRLPVMARGAWIDWWAELDDDGWGLPISESGQTEGPRIDKWAFDNTGIGERYDHKSALTVADSMDRFASLVDGRHLVGMVPSFDEERIRRDYRRHRDQMTTRFPWHYHLIDVEALAVGYLKSMDDHLGPPALVDNSGVLTLPWRSDDLSRMLGVEPPGGEDRHTALADARWAKAIYEKIMGKVS